MRRLLVWTIGLTVVLMAALYAVSSVGTPDRWIPAQVKLVLSAEAQNADQACWREICPGKTTIDQAQRILQKLPTLVGATRFKNPRTQLEWDLTTSPPVSIQAYWDIPTTVFNELQLMTFSKVPGLTLGDAIQWFGRPVTTNRICFTGDPMRRPAKIRLQVYFANGAMLGIEGSTKHIRQEATPPHRTLVRLQPWMQVISVAYERAELIPQASPNSGFQPWHGFAEIESLGPCW